MLFFFCKLDVSNMLCSCHLPPDERVERVDTYWGFPRNLWIPSPSIWVDTQPLMAKELLSIALANFKMAGCEDGTCWNRTRRLS